MTLINTGFSPTSDVTDIQDIYNQALYRPTHRISEGERKYTLEALNGGLTQENIASENKRSMDFPGDFREEKFQAGTFARGYFYGFNFPDRYHQHQFNVDRDELSSPYTPGGFKIRKRAHKRYFMPSYSLGCSVFIPYTAVVYVTFQGFFAHDGLKIDKGIDNYDDTDPNRMTYIGEFYQNRLYINGEYSKGTEVITPASKAATKTLPFEYRWRWHHKAKMVELKKGYHDFSVMVYPSLCVDHAAGKQQNYCGSISIVAIKAGAGNMPIRQWYGTDDFTFTGRPPDPPPPLKY